MRGDKKVEQSESEEENRNTKKITPDANSVETRAPVSSGRMITKIRGVEVRWIALGFAPSAKSDVIRVPEIPEGFVRRHGDTERNGGAS